MEEKIEFSIIIPFRTVDDYVKECVENLQKEELKKFEIILLPDSDIDVKFKNSKVYPTGPVKPSVKRNLGVKKSRGKYIVFIDADAYPKKGWLKNASKYLSDSQIGILGGPNIQPEKDGIMKKAGDDVLSSSIGSGVFSIRYSVKDKAKEVEELPSCNVFMRKSLFEKIGGFDTSLLTAEDSKLCFQIRKAGKKVLYCPDVVVYHHRRPLFRPYLKQIWIYGRDKATLLKTLSPPNKYFYFLPSLFILYLLFGLAIYLFAPGIQLIGNLYIISIIFYLIVVLIGSLMKSIKRSPLIFTGIILTHLTYGVSFLLAFIKCAININHENQNRRKSNKQ